MHNLTRAQLEQEVEMCSGADEYRERDSAGQKILTHDAALREELAVVVEQEKLQADDVTKLRQRVAELELRRSETVAMCDQLTLELTTVTREREFYMKQNLALLDRWNHGYTVTVEQERDALQASLEEVTRDYEAAQHLADATSREWQATKALLEQCKTDLAGHVAMVLPLQVRLREVEGALQQLADEVQSYTTERQYHSRHHASNDLDKREKALLAELSKAQAALRGSPPSVVDAEHAWLREGWISQWLIYTGYAEDARYDHWIDEKPKSLD